MIGNIRVEQLACRPLAVVRRKARQDELARVVPEACGAVWNVVRSQKLAGAGRHVSVYLDGQINLEVGVELDGPFSGYGDVVPSATPSGLVAWVEHRGPYSQLGRAHQAIQDWCAQSGYTLAGPSWEIYGHWQDDWNADPSQITTEVYYLVTPCA